ncbi:MAG: hypothetical protein PHZ03_01200 [Syntrophomonas sp.]|nr:hypothetical protein [Syntrophomonas sp.]
MNSNWIEIDFVHINQLIILSIGLFGSPDALDLQWDNSYRLGKPQASCLAAESVLQV